MAQLLREFTSLGSFNNAAQAPGGCQPLDQANQLEPTNPPVGSHRN